MKSANFFVSMLLWYFCEKFISIYVNDVFFSKNNFAYIKTIDSIHTYILDEHKTG